MRPALGGPSGSIGQGFVLPLGARSPTTPRCRDASDGCTILDFARGDRRAATELMSRLAGAPTPSWTGIESRRQTEAVDMKGLRAAWGGRSGVRRAPGRVGRASVAVAVVGTVAIVGGGLALAVPVSHHPVSLADASQSSATPSDEIRSAAPPIPGHEVYGFVPYWEIDPTIAAHLRATITTTVALFSVTHTSKGEIAT